jgi:Predicted ATPase (AAA+ superfamily)
MKTLSAFLISMCCLVGVHAQNTITVLDHVLFYDGYKTLESLTGTMEPVPGNVLRHSTSLYAVKLTEDQLNSFGDEINMYVVINPACDNYDRLGHVFLSFVPKGQETYKPEEVMRIEVSRYITPFMDKNKKPDHVPYVFDVSYLKDVFHDKALRNKYDFWFELNAFGVPYAANKQIQGCEERSDTFWGSLYFETFRPLKKPAKKMLLLPLFTNAKFNNYNENATDVLGKTVRTREFEIDKNLKSAKLVLITSNHGANRGGEEYIRRMHYVTFNGDSVLTYKPGRVSCEPFRERNTQSNGIYGKEVKTDERWQSFSNWCPGDVIDTRIIDLGSLKKGKHTFKIEVPEAEFKDSEGNFPLSLYLLGQ